MRRTTLWRLAFVGFIVAVVAAVAAYEAARSEPDSYSVAQYLELERAPRGVFRLSGWLDPESVVTDEAGVRFDVLERESLDAPRVTVVCAEGTSLDRSAFCVQECLVLSRAGEVPGTVIGVSTDPLVLRPWRGGADRPQGASRSDAFSRLSLVPKEAQLERLLGRTLEIEPVPEPPGFAAFPDAPVELYRDEDGVLRVWNTTLQVWVGTLPGNEDQTPGRVYPGEAPLDQCMERADALAREYYTGDGETFDELYRSWSRRVMENGQGREAAIVSYDVIYQRYQYGIALPDLVSVTVYALSGGSDFVGNQISDEITYTIMPRISPLRADAAVRAWSEARREDATASNAGEPASFALDAVPEDARLVDVQLLGWGDRLHWRLLYDWEPEPPVLEGAPAGEEAPIAWMCDHSEGIWSVDASTGEVIPLPIREP